MPDAQCCGEIASRLGSLGRSRWQGHLTQIWARVPKVLGLQCAWQSQEQQDGQRGGTAGTVEEEGGRRQARAGQATAQTLACLECSGEPPRTLCKGGHGLVTLPGGQGRGGAPRRLLPGLGWLRPGGSQEGGEK